MDYLVGVISPSDHNGHSTHERGIATRTRVASQPARLQRRPQVATRLPSDYPRRASRLPPVPAAREGEDSKGAAGRK